jgi:hypothetical protein
MVLAFAILAPWQRRWIGMHEHALHEMQARFVRYRDQIHALIPAPRKGARILLLADADGKEDRDIQFLIQLSYGDPTLRVERMTMWTDRQVQIDRIKIRLFAGLGSRPIYAVLAAAGKHTRSGTAAGFGRDL